MPVFVASRGGVGRGGTGFTLGPAQNTFGDTTTADRAAAETLRDAYATANADWLAIYDSDRSNFIQLVWNGGDVLQRRNVPGDAWEDGTNVIIGPVGPAGRNGAAGGGAWSSLGSDSEIGATRGSNVFVGTGITMPMGRSVFGYRLGGSVADFNTQAGIMVVAVAPLDSRAAADAGDTSTAANRIRLPEFGGGGSVGGSIHAGLTSARELLISTSNANQNFAIEVFDYVPSAVQGRRTDSEIDNLIAAYTGAIPGLAIPDAQLPASIMRDAEFTAAAVRGLLSLTQAELDSLLVGEGANITSGVLNIPQNDGSTLSLTLPTGGGGMPDGVINSLSIVGNVLTAGTTTGGSVELDLSTYLDARFLNQADNLSDVPAPGTALTNLGGLNQNGVRAQATGSFQMATALPANPYGGQKVLFIGDATGLTDAVDEGGTAVTEAASGDIFEYDAGDTRWERRIRLSAQAAVGSHTRYAAFSPDNTFSEAEWLAGNTSTGEQISFPVTTVAHFKGFAIPATEASLTVIQQVGNAFNSRASYSPAVGDTDVLQDIDGVSHKIYVAVAQDFAGASEDFILR